MHRWDKECKPCQISNLKENFINWTSGNEKVDNFIQKFQLKINDYKDIIIEWIPYDQIDNIKEISKNGIITICTAIWKSSPLNYDINKKIYKRDFINQNKKVTLICYNTQDITESLSEVRKFLYKFPLYYYF